MEKLDHKFGDDGVRCPVTFPKDTLTITDLLDVVSGLIAEISTSGPYPHIRTRLAHCSPMDVAFCTVERRLPSDTILS